MVRKPSGVRAELSIYTLRIIPKNLAESGSLGALGGQALGWTLHF